MHTNKQPANQGTSLSHLDTADFLSFSDSPAVTDFCPVNSSSPQKPWNHSNRGNRRFSSNRNNSFSTNYRNSSFNSSPQHFRNRSFNGPYENNQHKHYNNGPNSSFDNSWNRSTGYYGKKHNNEGPSNIARYVHSSFLENPWALLEQQRLEGARERAESELVDVPAENSDSDRS